MDGQHRSEDLDKALSVEAGIPIPRGSTTAAEQIAFDEEREGRANREVDAAYKRRQIAVAESANKATRANIRLTWFLAGFTAIGALAASYQGYVASQSTKASQDAAKAAINAVEIARDTLIESQVSNARQTAIADQNRKDSIAAGLASTRQADLALQATIDSAHREQRAWTGMAQAKPITYTIDGPSHSVNLTVAFTFKNYGRSAAEHVGFFAELEADPTIWSPSCNEVAAKNHMGDVLLPTQDRTLAWVMNPTPDRMMKGWAHQIRSWDIPCA